MRKIDVDEILNETKHDRFINKHRKLYDNTSKIIKQIEKKYKGKKPDDVGGEEYQKAITELNDLKVRIEDNEGLDEVKGFLWSSILRLGDFNKVVKDSILGYQISILKTAYKELKMIEQLLNRTMHEASPYGVDELVFPKKNPRIILFADLVQFMWMIHKIEMVNNKIKANIKPPDKKYHEHTKAFADFDKMTQDLHRKINFFRNNKARQKNVMKGKLVEIRKEAIKVIHKLTKIKNQIATGKEQSELGEWEEKLRKLHTKKIKWDYVDWDKDPSKPKSIYQREIPKYDRSKPFFKQ